MLHLFLKKSPFIKLIIPLIGGIYISYNTPIYSEYWLPSLVFFAISFLVVLLWQKRKASYQNRYLTGIVGFIFFFLFGICYMQSRMPLKYSGNNEANIRVQLIESIGETDKNFKYEAYLQDADADSLNTIINCRGIVYLPKNHENKTLQEGNVLLITGRFLPFTTPDSPFDFDYSAYLVSQRIAFRIIASDYSIGKSVRVLNSYIYSAKLKSYLRNKFEAAGLSSTELAILNALFLGDKSRLTYEQKVAFSNAGAMHLLAVSGLHVGIIYMLLLGLFRAIGLKKENVLVALLLISILWIYALITGFSPSVLRASLMFTILEIGRISKQKTGIFNLLGASMFIIIILEPLSVFNIGFWLSHCAVASIVCFYPAINRWFYFSFPPFRWIWSIIAVSIAAQIGTLPICIYAFYGFPIYFIITNVLLIPIVTPILVLSVLAAIFSFSASILAFLIPALGDLLSFMEQVALWIDSLPYSILTNLYLNKVQLFTIYLSIILFLVYLEYRFVKYLKYFLVSVIAVVFTIHLRNHNLPDEVLYVANVKGKSVVNYISKSENIIYSCSELSEKEIDFAFSGIWAYNLASTNYTVEVLNGKQNCTTVVNLIGDENVVILPQKANWNQGNGQIAIDKLILLGKPDLSLTQVGESVEVDEIIIPNGWKWYHKRSWLKGDSLILEKIHDVDKDGVLFVTNRNRT